MTIQTSRFGELKVSQDNLLLFPEGILGFANLRSFVLLDDPEDDIFIWLQSCENKDLAFPVLEPELLMPSYTVELSLRDKQVLELSEDSDCRCLSIITIPADPTDMTANLKAPIVINAGKQIARQCICQNNKLSINEPIFSKLQQRIVKNPSYRLKSGPLELDFTVPLVKGGAEA